MQIYVLTATDDNAFLDECCGLFLACVCALMLLNIVPGVAASFIKSLAYLGVGESNS